MMTWRVNQLNLELGEPMVHFSVGCTRDGLEDLYHAMLMYRHNGDFPDDNLKELGLTIKYLSAVLKSFDLMMESSDQFILDEIDCEDCLRPAVMVL